MREIQTIKKLNEEVKFKMRKILLIAAMAAMAVLSFSSLAFADHSWFQGNPQTIYKTSTADAVAKYSAASNCIICHTTVGSTDPTIQAKYASSGRNNVRTFGPHGGYTTTTRRCAACHVIHSNVKDNGRTAPISKLLPGQTVTGVCSFCHDLTGSENSAYATYYLTDPSTEVKSAHYVEGVTPGDPMKGYKYDAGLTSPAYALAADVLGANRLPVGSIPGGNAATGGTLAYAGVFKEGDLSLNGTTVQFTCDSCHTPHAIEGSTVNPYFGENLRKSGSLYNSVVTYAGSRLLKKTLTVGGAAYTTYGSAWCAGCHTGRLTMAGSNYNHPVNTSATGLGYNVGKIALKTEGLGTTIPFATYNSATEASMNAGYVAAQNKARGIADTIFIATADVTGAKATTNVGLDTEPIDVVANRLADRYPVYNSWYTMTSGDALNGNAARPDSYIKISEFQSAVQGVNGPSCQQCHASTRNVEDSFAQNMTDELHFSFPHVGTAQYLLVEQNTDDLCTNCHGLDNLP